MYRVTVTNGTSTTVIHDTDPDSLQKLASGSFTDEVNVVPNMTFSIFPQNAGYTALHPLTTEIEVYNTVKHRTEFEGCLRKQTGSMKKSGQIAYKWTAEGFMGYLMDTVQDYHTYENTDVPDFLTALLTAHNAMVEPRKRIYLGQCDVHDTSSKTTAYRRTLDEIRELLVNRLGGEIRVRKVNGVLYLDYLTHYGSNSTTKIELARNLQEIEVTSDPSNIITRLIPLGAKLNDETAERLTIASVNGGCIWIDDQTAFAEYGTYQCATQEWDDVTVPANLLTRAQQFLQQNNVRKRHYKLTALDLSLIGLDVDSFTTGDSYKTVNPLIGVNDWLRCVKRTVNITEPQKSALEIGEKTESLTVKANRTYNYVTYEIPKVESDVLTKAHERASAMLGLAGNSYLEFNEADGEILIMNSRDKYGATTRVWRYNSNGWGVSNTGYNGSYNMAATFDYGFSADFITVGTLHSIEIINGDHGEFTVDSSGNVTASSITITGGTINNGNGTFQVLPNGTVNASAMNITGGSIHITTASESYDVIQLEHTNQQNHTWHSHTSPLEFYLSNSGTGAEWKVQAGAMHFDNNGDTASYFGGNMIAFYDNGTLKASFQGSGLYVNNNGVNDQVAKMVSGTATINGEQRVVGICEVWNGTDWINLTSVAARAEANAANITTLWNAVFGSS